MNVVKDFIVDERGATATEYGLIAAFISIVIISALTLVGSNLSQVYIDTANAL